MNLRKNDLHRLYIRRESSRIIPVFLACDDAYVKYMMVCLRSLIEHTTDINTYRIYILHTNITPENMAKVKAMATKNVSIDFCDVKAELQKIQKKLVVRDYYSLTTYYRIFIPDLFKQYDKIIYIDSDTIILKDVAEMYKYNLGDNYVGAIADYAVSRTKIFKEYVESVLGISSSAYFNAGVLLMNSRQFRIKNMRAQFVELLNTYSFVVAQDQDYLNILCRDKVLWIDSKWNVQASETAERPYKEIGLIHYNFARKPWNSEEGRYVDAFWKYAKKTQDYEILKEGLANYSEEDRAKELASGEHLMNLAQQEIENEDNYFNKFVGVHDNRLTRQEVMARIEQYEREGRFDEDVEEDPPGKVLMPNDINYLDNSWRKRISRKYAFKMAKWFVRTLIRKKQLIIKEYKGIENYRKLRSGAIITCNHFNAFDSFAMHLTYQKSYQITRKFYRIIKEGNYTSFPGFFGFLMRNCYTLPLSSNSDTMKKLLKAVDKILSKGHFILVYPEQSMWWNYRKPKPLKRGAYIFAARNNVPVLPCFITMEDTNYPGEGGFPVQAYTVHVAPPIYPDPAKTQNENVREMMRKNAEVWREIYEKTYGIPLTYTTEKRKTLD